MISSTRISCHVDERPLRVSGSRSLAKPGSMPEVKNEDPPVRHASSSCSRRLGMKDFGCTSGTTELDTTFLPAARMRQMSWIASNGRRSAVAV
jgi:hypothetical protein